MMITASETQHKCPPDDHSETEFKVCETIVDFFCGLGNFE